MMEIAIVCSKFRFAALKCPVPIRLPLQDRQLHLVSKYKIPVSSLYNEQPALYVNYQVATLNLSRLNEAQLVANDYLAKSNMTQLSPHYMAILYNISISSPHVKKLILNVDLSREESNRKLYTCARLIANFKKLTFLSLHFTAQIELQEKIKSSTSSQENIQKNFIQFLVTSLPKLKYLYLHSCPVQGLCISSESIEKLCIYKSEFVHMKYLNTPKLKVLMFHEGMQRFFKKIHETEEAGISSTNQLDIFRVIYNGCPSIENFNNVDLGVLRPHNLSVHEWCHYALKISYKKCSVKSVKI